MFIFPCISLDINECSRSGTCSQNERCANTYGSYNCFAISPTQSTLKCAPGLVVDSSGLQCQGKVYHVMCYNVVELN